MEYESNSIYIKTYINQVLNNDAFSSFPSCSSFSSDAESITTLKKLNVQLNGGLHGPVHILIGGQWYPDFIGDKYDTILSDYFSLPSDILLFAKNLWRQGYLRYPSSCSAEDSTEDCLSSCPLLESKAITPYELLSKSSLFHFMESEKIYYGKSDDLWHIKDMTIDLENEVFKMLATLVCSTYYPGEMYSSSSPYDPTFWPIHPSAEKFLNVMRLKDDFDDTWGYYKDGSTVSDTGIVCDWDDVATKYDLPDCKKRTCSGHAEDDLLPFTYFKDNFYPMTNGEFYAYIHPTNTEVPYIYDTLTFEYCSSEGYSI